MRDERKEGGREKGERRQRPREEGERNVFM